MSSNPQSNDEIYLVLECIMVETMLVIFGIVAFIMSNESETHRRRQPRRYNMLNRIPAQVINMRNLVELDDVTCKDQLRMDRNAFNRFCKLLTTVGGLMACKYVSVQEQVAIFLSILAHHKKNRIVKDKFNISGETVSKHFHSVLKAVLKLHQLLLVEPSPVPEDCTDPRWKCFEGCLGALDGTYIDVKVPIVHKARYRNRKGRITMNVLGVCDRDMQFVYVLSGWEGSAADTRVLRDAVICNHGLKVPFGCYYL